MTWALRLETWKWDPRVRDCECDNPEDFYTKDWVVVQTRPKLTLGAAHVNQPFYNVSEIVVALTYYTSDVIDALTNKASMLLYSRPISTLHTVIIDCSGVSWGHTQKVNATPIKFYLDPPLHFHPQRLLHPSNSWGTVFVTVDWFFQLIAGRTFQYEISLGNLLVRCTVSYIRLWILKKIP